MRSLLCGSGASLSLGWCLLDLLSAEQGTVSSLLALHPCVLSQKQQECPCRALFSHNITQCPTCFFSAAVPVLRFGCRTEEG